MTDAEVRGSAQDRVADMSADGTEPGGVIRSAGSFAMAKSPLFVAADADGVPCVWIDADNVNGPDALLRIIDIPAVGRDALWAQIVKNLPHRYDEARPLADRHRGLRGHANARKRADS